MRALETRDVERYVQEHIGTFHQKRIQSIDDLRLTDVLSRKNPYLFKAKFLLTSGDIVRALADAHVSSSEEAIFGNWLEGLAIFINGEVYGGKKSGIKGIDLEFEHQDKRYIVTIKSGPNWGNSGQVRKMIEDFASASRTLRTSGSGMNVVAVNGCCYGRDSRPDKGTYHKLCGQRFWEFISADVELYTRIVEPLGLRAKERNDDFQRAYARRINRLTEAFSRLFCTEAGDIDWHKLVQFNSGVDKPP
jgi:hypothetical protein